MAKKIAIAVLSAGVKKNQDGLWQNLDLTAEDGNLGAPGGQQRALAAAYLYRRNPHYSLIVFGGRGKNIKNDELGRPNLCEIMKNNLADLGVPVKAIAQEDKSNTTFEQLKELPAMVKKMDLEKVILISSAYHLPRIKEMIKAAPGLESAYGNFSLEIKSAEEIIKENDLAYWQNSINPFYQTEEMQARIALEKKGLADLQKGKYKF